MYNIYKNHFSWYFLAYGQVSNLRWKTKKLLTPKYLFVTRTLGASRTRAHKLAAFFSQSNLARPFWPIRNLKFDQLLTMSWLKEVITIFVHHFVLLTTLKVFSEIRISTPLLTLLEINARSIQSVQKVLSSQGFLEI